jgi:hypothetical protein
MLTDILKKINREKDIFDFGQIQIVPGYDFNQKQMIEKIYRYYNSKFSNGDVDADGDKKYFFNIVKNPCKVTTKSIDFDTKHIRVLTASGGNELKTWYFEIDLQHWMEKNGFGIVLNRIFYELPIYGSVVLKIIKGVPHFVDLRNFIVEQSADTLNDANYITERHLYTPVEFRKVGNKMGWNSVEATIAEHRKMDKPYIAVYERYGEIESTSEEGTKSYEYKRIYVADVGVDTTDNSGIVTAHNGFILKEDKVDSHPYWEFHMEKIAGRWMGVGVVETLIDPQIRENELVNLQSKSSYWAALRLFQTRDQGVARNLMTDVRNGEVLKGDSEITQIDMSDRNLAFFNEETQKWLANRDELVFSFDVVQGERLPAGTPLGSAQLASAQIATYFGQVQENIALNVKELLKQVVIPTFKQENSVKHNLRLVGQNLDKYRNMLINQKVNEKYIDYVATKMTIPSNEEYDLMKTTIGEMEKQGKEKILELPASFYEDLEYDIKIDIGEESKDTRAMTQVFFAILQALTADPTILTDPTKKKVFFKAIEYSGINPEEISADEPTPTIQNQMQNAQGPMKGAGGGVSAPGNIAGSGMNINKQI